MMTGMAEQRQRRAALPREERERRVLDTAARLFYARGVHEVGMDELVASSGLAKASVYRLYPSKDALVGAYLTRLSAGILAAIDRDIAAHSDDPAAAVRAIFAAIAEDLARPAFRGCPFNNASIEFPDPDHPARIAAREYRAALLHRLERLCEQSAPGEGARRGAQLAVIVDGLYTSAAHLGHDGPAAHASALIEPLLRPG
jgi:AcrR family transcriptional regulator